MNYKKLFISIIALIVVFAAIYVVWRWQHEVADQPTRQEQDIR